MSPSRSCNLHIHGHLRAACSFAVIGLLSACGGGNAPTSAVSDPTPVAASLTSAVADDTVNAQATSSTKLFANGVYGSGVSNWSWNLCNASPTAVVGNVTALLFDECQGDSWSSGGYLHRGTAISNATSLQFDIYLGASPATTAQQISLAFGSGTTNVALSKLLPSPVANAWNAVSLDLGPVLSGQAFQDFMLMNASGHPKFYLNNVVVKSGSSTGGGTGSSVSIAIDAKAGVHDISPLI